MAWQSGGGLQLPGITSDGADGLVIAGALVAGDPNKTPQPNFHQLNGSTTIQEAVSNFLDDDPVLVVNQDKGGGAVGNGNVAVFIQRSGSVAAGDWSDPAVLIKDSSASVQPVARVTKQGTTVEELKTLESITGALSTVTDAAAKAVLTSIIATLTGIKVAANNTT